MRVRTSARLHGGNLFRISDVADVEDPNAAEAIFLRRRKVRPGLSRRARRIGRKSLGTAIKPAVRRLDRHKHQVLINRRVALSARTNDRCHKSGFCRIGDIVDVNAVIVSHEYVIALECEVGIGERSLRNIQLNGLWYFRGVADTERRQHLLYPRIVGVVGAELKSIRLFEQLQVPDAQSLFTGIVQSRRKIGAGVGRI